jgi:hypothetical protein
MSCGAWRKERKSRSCEGCDSFVLARDTTHSLFQATSFSLPRGLADWPSRPGFSARQQQHETADEQILGLSPQRTAPSRHVPIRRGDGHPTPFLLAARLVLGYKRLALERLNGQHPASQSSHLPTTSTYSPCSVSPSHPCLLSSASPRPALAPLTSYTVTTR